MTKLLSDKNIAVALMIIGVGLAIWGYQESNNIGNQLANSLTGSFTDKVMFILIGAAASFGVGLFMFRK
jgi:hypothetical protein